MTVHDLIHSRGRIFSKDRLLGCGLKRADSSCLAYNAGGPAVLAVSTGSPPMPRRDICTAGCCCAIPPNEKQQNLATIA